MYKRQDFTISFLDMVFNTMLFFVLMFVMMLCKQSKHSEIIENLKPNCIFVIEAIWSSDNNSDVDIYVEDPAGNLIYYRQKDAGIMNLDRDDVGLKEFVKTELGEFEYKDNREIVTLRGVVPGEYILNIHAYAKRSKEPILVSVAIHKMQPFGTAFKRYVVLTEDGQEETVCRFTLSKDGQFSGVRQEQKKFVKRGSVE